MFKTKIYNKLMDAFSRCVATYSIDDGDDLGQTFIDVQDLPEIKPAEEQFVKSATGEYLIDANGDVIVVATETNE